MASHIIAADRYLILDSKNHLVFPLNREALEAGDGRPRTHLHSYPIIRYAGTLNARSTIMDWSTRNTSHSSPRPATPFVMHTEIARNVIVDLSNREGRCFELAFIKCRLTEFFAYTCFAIKSGRNLAELYDFHQPPTPCIWEHAATSSGCKQIVGESIEKRYPFFAVHRAALTKLDDDARR